MQQSSGSVSNRHSKSATDVNKELKLNGDKIILEDRRFSKENLTASFKSLHLAKGPARPSSAIPMLRLYKNNDDFEPSFCSTRRPFSAENIRHIKMDKQMLSDMRPNTGQFSVSLQSIDELDQDPQLPSTDLLKNIISDTSENWGILKKNSLNQRRSEEDILKTDNHGLKLTPGLVKKPPIPSKKSLQENLNKHNLEQNSEEPVDISTKMEHDTIRSDFTDYSNKSNLELLENFTKKYEAIEEKLVETRINNSKERDLNSYQDYQFDNYVSPITFNTSAQESYVQQSPDIPEIKCEDWDLKPNLEKDVEMKEYETDLLFQSLKASQTLNENTKNGYKSGNHSLNLFNSSAKSTTSQRASNTLKSKVPTLKAERKNIKFNTKMIPSSKDIIKEPLADVETWIAKELDKRSTPEKMNSNLPSSSQNNDVDTWILENSLEDQKEKYSNRVLREFLDTPEELKQDPIVPMCQDNQDALSNDGSSTYDDIASILELLEGETKKSQNKMTAIQDIMSTELCSKVIRNLPDSLPKCTENVEAKQMKIPDDKLLRVHSKTERIASSNYNELLSYLDEVDKNCSRSLNMAKERVYEAQKLLEHTVNLDTVPRAKDLLSYSKEELSQQIIDHTLRLKEKSSSVNLLQSELSSLRDQIVRMTKEGDLIIKQKIKSQKDDCELVVKRHQKFIDQLIADKKKLSEQYESLLKEMKSMEDRFESNVRALEHKHKVELQKVRDMHLAAEKVRRDKWIDIKTKKIKEMTVKSIEPELQSMNLRQQKELSDLRYLHKQEIEDLDLKAARKLQEQCEKLRETLTDEREKALAHEREVMRIRYEKLVESEERGYQEQRRRLLQEHANRLSECEEKEANILVEKDKAIKINQEDFEEKLQSAIRRHNSEIQILKERTEVEIECWKNNYRKQQTKQLIDKEAAIRESCKKERDREIEAVIERLENEATETKQQIEESTENRIRRMKEKFETELRDLEQSEREAQSKCAQFKTKLSEGDDRISGLKAEMKQLETQLHEYKELYGKLLTERNEVKDVIRNEMKVEMDSLNIQIITIQSDKDNEMQQVCSRVKVALARKDEIISEITRDNGALQEKCKYLESMLDQQRKDYLIK